MNTLLNYLLEAHLALLIVALADYLLLHRETDISLRRKLLLGGVGLAVVAPLLHVPFQQLNAALPTLAYTIPPDLEPQQVSETVALTSGLSTLEVFALCYGGVAILFLLHTGYQVARLVALRLRLRGQAVHNIYVYELPSHQAAFSFFNHVFVPAAQAHAHAHVIEHERSHARLGHSYDILAIEIVKAFLWLNPAVYAIKQRLMAIHEFEADREALKHANPHAYETTLVEEALQGIQYPIVNHFNQHLILKRIAMMKQLTHKIAHWKLGVLGTILLAATVFIACQDQILSEMKDSTISQVTNYPPDVKADIDRYQKQYPKARFVYLEGQADEIRGKLKEYPEKSELIMNSYEFPDRNMMGVLTVDLAKYELKDENEVFSVVEEAAKPKQGFELYMAGIGSRIQYPADARQRNIEGKVFVQFTVTETGALSDFQVVKGIGGGCDQEAVRIIQEGGDWVPGRQRGQAVKQRMVIPIMFMLGNSQPATISIGQIQEGEPQIMDIDGNLQKVNNGYVLTGQVKDTNGKPLPGINIVVAGSTQGTVTNMDGRYRLEVQAEKGALVYSFIGFRTERIEFGNN
jgi:TonB family protein